MTFLADATSQPSVLLTLKGVSFTELGLWLAALLVFLAAVVAGAWKLTQMLVNYFFDTKKLIRERQIEIEKLQEADKAIARMLPTTSVSPTDADVKKAEQIATGTGDGTIVPKE